MPCGDQRGDRVAGGHHQHLDDRPGAAACHMWAREHGNPCQPDAETEYSPRSEPSLAAGEAVENRRDYRRCGDQQAGQRTCQMAFGVREQKPRGDDLEEREGEQGLPVLADHRRNSARQREREQHRRADRGPREHQDRDRYAFDRDLDHQIGNSPDDAHRDEQQPSARAHADHITRRREPLNLRGDRETSRECDLPAGSRAVWRYECVGRDNSA